MVIPILDENPVRRVPVMTYVLIALNIGFFVTEPVAARGSTVCRQEAYFERWGAIPRELVHNEQLPTTVVADEGATICAIARPDYTKQPVLSAFTAMFLHGGWLHLIGNMLFLYVFGNNVEDRLGRARFLFSYLAWGLAATYGFALLNPTSTTPVVGASGAIAGVLGAYLVLFPRARVLSLVPAFFFLPARLPAWIVLGSWFLLQWLYASGPGVADATGVAYAAHVVGFVFGMVVAAIRLRRGHETPRGSTARTPA